MPFEDIVDQPLNYRLLNGLWEHDETYFEFRVTNNWIIESNSYHDDSNKFYLRHRTANIKVTIIDDHDGNYPIVDGKLDTEFFKENSTFLTINGTYDIIFGVNHPMMAFVMIQIPGSFLPTENDIIMRILIVNNDNITRPDSDGIAYDYESDHTEGDCSTVVDVFVEPVIDADDNSVHTIEY